MNIKIKMLDVNDGDAIIVFLSDSSRKILILIDGGHKGDATKTVEAIQPFLDDAGKAAPDLIVCTHYDRDHIGGLKDIVKHYLDNNATVSKVWIHAPGIALKKAFEEAAEILDILNKDGLTMTVNERVLLKKYEAFLMGEDAAIILKSWDDMNEFVAFLNANGVAWEEPFKKATTIQGWPEITVLGPTREYYDSLFPPGKKPQSLLKEELNMLAEERKVITEEVTQDLLDNPCEYLDENKTSITATNRASVLILISAEGKKFLFTGDAGIESFEQAHSDEAFKNIFWLKVPHHGSRNNLDSEWIEWFSAKHAFVSGKRHADDEVMGCLENHGAEVKLTSIDGDLEFEQ